MVNSIWIIFRKLDKLWSYAHNGEPGQVVSEKQALKSLNELMEQFWYYGKSEDSEYIVWKFEV